MADAVLASLTLSRFCGLPIDSLRAGELPPARRPDPPYPVTILSWTTLIIPHHPSPALTTPPLPSPPFTIPSCLSTSLHFPPLPSLSLHFPPNSSPSHPTPPRPTPPLSSPSTLGAVVQVPALTDRDRLRRPEIPPSEELYLQGHGSGTPGKFIVAALLSLLHCSTPPHPTPIHPIPTH